jgi:hypothetical protein
VLSTDPSGGVAGPPAEPVLAVQQGRYDPGAQVDAVETTGIWIGIVWLPILLTIGVLTAIAMFGFRRVRRTA